MNNYFSFLIFHFSFFIFHYSLIINPFSLQGPATMAGLFTI